jgi:hypothetical protein
MVTISIPVLSRHIAAETRALRRCGTGKACGAFCPVPALPITTCLPRRLLAGNRSGMLGQDRRYLNREGCLAGKESK